MDAQWLQPFTPQDLVWLDCRLPLVGQLVTADECKRIALNVALGGTGFVSPNPLVGAVAVDCDHRFLGAAAHLKIGNSHAEASLLNEISASGRTDKLKNATMYVTLEPCAHVGRTPSCAEALAEIPLKKVVYGAHDPNPQVNGQGAARLRRAGIETVFDESWSEDCEELAEAFLYAMKVSKGSMPAALSEAALFIGMKVASTLDGVIAQKGDQRRWITGKPARNFGHYLRQRYDSILVGPETALADNPSLDVRYPGMSSKRVPLRIVLDPLVKWSSAESTAACNLVQQNPDRTVAIVPIGARIPRALVTEGITFLQLPLESDSLQFSWGAISSAISSLGVQSLLIEGGQGVYSSALKSGLVKKIHWFCAPNPSGMSSVDSNALRWFHCDDGNPSIGFDDLKVPPPLKIRRQVRLGRDLLVEGYWQP